MSAETAALPAPYHANLVGMILTLRCNAECTHCCFDCTPRSKEQMTRTQALDYVTQIAAQETVNALTVTGGEPFTAYEVLRAIIEEAGRRGLDSRIVSNCYWADSLTQARKKLLPLVDAGLTTLNVSCDAFHEQYVEAANVKYAVESALALGLEVTVSHVALHLPQEKDIERIYHSLGLTEDSPINVLSGLVIPAGRAARNYSLDQMDLADIDSDAGQRLHEACSNVIRQPAITPNGEFVACCGTTKAADRGFRDEYVVGNLHERALADLLEELELDALFTALMIEGPWYFYQRLKELDSGIFPRKRFVSICDLCVQVVCNERAREMLQEILDREGLHLLVKKMMLETARREKLEAAAGA